MAKKVEIIGAAKVLQGFIWQDGKVIKMKITRENKIEIEQQELLDYLMRFQEWQINEINKNQTE